MLMASLMRREGVNSRRLTLRLSHNTATTSVFGVSLLQSRGIRTVIAPRPAVTTLVYIDKYGRPLRNSTETDLSLIRTRDNKFYLQRVLEGGEVIRWRAPGLDHLKNVTNFETYTLNEIDEYGGVVIPADLMPTASNDPPSFHDAVYYINRVEAKKKFTRKDRRQWHRRLFAHWKESPEKFLNHSIGAYGMPFLFVLWLTIRAFIASRTTSPSGTSMSTARRMKSRFCRTRG
ncbi:hypothetical protein TcBrA4_0004660 [Trypanosoma cruzi]|nr:hypothetical protein TcBrA4_0004660 [Trypanosoma cruzi]